MANNVQNIIEIKYDGQEYIKSFLEKIGSIHTKDEALDTLYDDSENTRSWWEDNIGAKWAYIEDFEYDDTSATLTIVSAWSQVTPFVEYLDNQTNNETSIKFTYIDEMPNFIGYMNYENGEVIHEYEEMDMWSVIEKEAKVRAKKENKNFQDEDEERDWMWDWMWEFVHETISENVNV